MEADIGQAVLTEDTQGIQRLGTISDDCRMWSDADNRLVNVTPKTRSESTRAMPGSGGRHVLLLPPTIVHYDFSRLCHVEEKFRTAQVVILLISVVRVWTSEADIIRYVSSAVHLTIALSG